MNDKEHCRSCGAELVMCDECHGAGRVQVDGPRNPETGEIGYSENCGECGGRGGYAAPAISIVELKNLEAELRSEAAQIDPSHREGGVWRRACISCADRLHFIIEIHKAEEGK